MVLTPAQAAELSRACLATIHPFVVRTTVVSSSVLHWARVQKTTETDNHQQIGQICQEIFSSPVFLRYTSVCGSNQINLFPETVTDLVLRGELYQEAQFYFKPVGCRTRGCDLDSVERQV